MMAGVLQINPLPYTLRQLTIMYEAQLLHAWDQTILLATHLANVPVVLNNMFGKRKLQPHSFLGMHPFRQSKSSGMKLTRENFRSLKRMFVDGPANSQIPEPRPQ
jgi:hypothetical protein